VIINYKGIVDKRILVKITSRERPDKLKKCIQSALNLSENPTKISWLISLDTDDSKVNHTLIKELQSIIPDSFIYFGSSTSKISAINRDVETFTKLNSWDILVNLSDDQICRVKGWDNIIRNKMPNDLNHSLWFYDGLQQSINTMEIVGFNYWDRTKNIYEPSYKSFYCDEESTMVAQKLKRLIKDNQCLFSHEHPAGNKNIKTDGLYEKNQRHWDEDKANFNNRLNINFGV